MSFDVVFKYLRRWAVVRIRAADRGQEAWWAEVERAEAQQRAQLDEAIAYEREARLYVRD